MEQLSVGTRVALNKARLSLQACVCVPVPELMKMTSLSRSGTQTLLRVAAASCRHTGPTAVVQVQSLSLSSGCPALDSVLRGGLPAGLIELAGESGAGKTQLALQFCLSVQYPLTYGGLGSGAVYISTEDVFPWRRLQQLISGQTRLRGNDVPPSVLQSLCLSDGVYIEHCADLDSLQLCLTRRVPLLLARGSVRFLVVDSLAAVFRSEFEASDWLLRSEQLITLSTTLHRLSREHNIPVLCINQVMDVFSSDQSVMGPISSPMVPALGLLWANQVTVRLMLRRLPATVSHGEERSAERRLDVVFAPHLPRGSVNMCVWSHGVTASTAATTL